jgi:hypothetical protein
MFWLLQWGEELTKLDELLALLAQAPPSPESEIAQEHIRSARSCVLGSMPAECELKPKTCPDCDRAHCRRDHAAQCSEDSGEFAVQQKILSAATRMCLQTRRTLRAAR